MQIVQFGTRFINLDQIIGIDFVEDGSARVTTTGIYVPFESPVSLVYRLDPQEAQALWWYMTHILRCSNVVELSTRTQGDRSGGDHPNRTPRPLGGTMSRRRGRRRVLITLPISTLGVLLLAAGVVGAILARVDLLQRLPW